MNTPKEETILRDSFIIYRSYWEGLRCMTKEVQCEVYNAIMQYGFTGSVPEMSDVARGVFILMKPNIDVSLTRYSNGRKGGKASAARRGASTTYKADKALTFEQEVDEMLSNKTWSEPVCMKLSISPEQLSQRLNEFLTHVKVTMDGNGHNSLGDARRHFLSWHEKKYPPAPIPEDAPPPDYTFTGGFGGEDN